MRNLQSFFDSCSSNVSILTLWRETLHVHVTCSILTQYTTGKSGSILSQYTMSVYFHSLDSLPPKY